jgi:hypothetical protein
MRRLTVMTTLLLLTSSACGKSTFRSAQGQFCSSTDDDDPYYECLLGMGLVCASTHSMPVLDDNGNEKSRFPVYLCRSACAPVDGGTGCRVADEICCKATTFGRTYADRPWACVPAQFCPDAPDAGPKPDARTSPKPDGAGDDAADAGALPDDAQAPDAPTPDAPAPDAPAPDAPAPGDDALDAPAAPDAPAVADAGASD